MNNRPVTLRLRPFAPTLAVQAAHFNRVPWGDAGTRPTGVLTPVWRMPANKWALSNIPWFARGLPGPKVPMRTERGKGITPSASAPEHIEDKRVCQGSIRPTPTWYGPCDVCPFVDSCNPCATHGCKEDLYRQMAQTPRSIP